MFKVLTNKLNSRDYAEKAKYYDDITDEEFLDTRKREAVNALTYLKDRYEEKHETTVKQIVFAGEVSTSMGLFTGGKVISTLDDIFSAFDKCDEVTLDIEEDFILYFYATHKYGVHWMNLYFITEEEEDSLGLNSSAEYETFYEILIKKGTPVKVDMAFCEDLS